MSDTNLTMTTNLRGRNLVKIPTAFIEQQGLPKRAPLTVIWGKNYQFVAILPAHVKMSSRMEERLTLLCNEPLEG